jgi:hypothetical protein
MSKHRIPALALFVVIAFLLLEGLGRCMLSPSYSDYGEAPDYRD